MLSIRCTSPAKDTPSRAAASRKAVQKAFSRLTDVLWPAIVNERFTGRAVPSATVAMPSLVMFIFDVALGLIKASGFKFGVSFHLQFLAFGLAELETVRGGVGLPLIA